MNDLNILNNNTDILVLDSEDDIYQFIWTISDKPSIYQGLNVELAIKEIIQKIQSKIGKKENELVEQLPTNKETIVKIISYAIDDTIPDLTLLCDVSQLIETIPLQFEECNFFDEFSFFIKRLVYKALINATLNHISEYDLQQILSLTGFPVTVVFERYYCDKVHRDSYYNYFSRMFRDINRNCHRLSFFKGEFDLDAFYGVYDSDDTQLQLAFMGCMVLTASFDLNNQTSIGRVFFDPCKINIPDCYIRTTRFSFCVLGRKFELEAYPFIRQNLVSMSCSESSLWNILEYFGNKYSDYKRLLPSDIIDCLDDYNEERMIPSSGLENSSFSAVLKHFGFEPKQYTEDQYHEKLKKFFHRYIESAVIVAMELINPDSEDSSQDSHSVVCIGHAKERVSLNLVLQDEICFDKLPKTSFCVLDSSCFYKDYVIIDDNQVPYIINEYGAFSAFKNMKMIGFTAPIYKHVYLDAVDVELIVKSFLDSAGGALLINAMFDKHGIKNNADDNPLVLRYFLTTSRNFKRHRFSTSQSLDERIFYSNIVFPKMIWVCELIDYSLYTRQSVEKCVLGEIVIDSTAVKSELFNSILSLRICDFISFRTPQETYDSIRRDISATHDLQSIPNYEFIFPYKMYSNNLKLNKKGGSQANEDS